MRFIVIWLLTTLGIIFCLCAGMLLAVAPVWVQACVFVLSVSALVAHFATKED